MSSFRARPALVTCSLLLALGACSRQFAITVNNQSVYDPRLPETGIQVADPGLQGCLNLALRQADSPDPAALTVLSCPAANVLDLTGIDQLVNLRFVDLAQNQVSDLRPLTTLPRLAGLSLPDNPLTDISPLYSMPSLTAVILTGDGAIPCSQLDRLEQRLGPNLTRPSTCRD